MKKKLFVIFLIIFFIASSLIYLNTVFLPKKAKALIIDSLQKITRKKADIKGIKINIFKGVSLEGLSIYDEKQTIARFKEVNFIVLFQPFFKKRLIIPYISFKQAELFLERRKDLTFNIEELFPKRTIGAQDAPRAFNISIYKVRLSDCTIHFQDNSMEKPFIRDFNKLNLTLYLSLPSQLRFNFSSGMDEEEGFKINIIGSFKFPQRELEARIISEGLSFKGFSNYYKNFGVDITEGTADYQIDLKLKDRELRFFIQSQNKNLLITKENISVAINSDIKADLQYFLGEGKDWFKAIKMKKLFGQAIINDSRISGLQSIGPIENINGILTLSDLGVSSDRINGVLWGLPFTAKANLAEWDDPKIDLNISSNVTLDNLQDLLKEKIKLTIPGRIEGKGSLSLAIKSRFYSKEAVELKGKLDIANGSLKEDFIPQPIEGITGSLEFKQDEVSWPELNFIYLGRSYKTTGTLTGFRSPLIRFDLSSKDLNLYGVLSSEDKILKIQELKCGYLNSEFLIKGETDTAETLTREARFQGTANIELSDILAGASVFLQEGDRTREKVKMFFDRFAPKGLTRAQFNIDGNIKDLRYCAISAKMDSPSFSILGFKAEKASLNYNQREGIIDIPLMHLSLYNGSADVNGKLNLFSENLPYWLSLDAKGIDIEKLKQDTKAKDKDISGILSLKGKINGFLNSPSRISGNGEALISKGKLWQLNLFQGMGKLIFAKDFANIVFNEGKCKFTISKEHITTGNLRLTSALANLFGSVDLGFDKSIEASLNVEIADEFIPLTGTYKDVATAIIGRAGSFGVINISGNLDEPRYGFTPAVIGIIKELNGAVRRR